jgi:hypothetical protein
MQVAMAASPDDSVPSPVDRQATECDGEKLQFQRFGPVMALFLSPKRR